LEILGRGGASIVYRTQDQLLHREVALKINDSDDETLFLKEARIAARLSHAGIVPIYDLGRLEDGRDYISMKILEGETLERHLQNGERDPAGLKKNLKILSRVCDAVAHAHAQGILHLDIKPANILIASFGQIYLLDWGSAYFVGESRERPTGTLSYLSPEQCKPGVPLTEQVDIFALGASLYQILSGHPPYSARSRAAYLHKAARTDFSHKPLKLCPEELREIVLRAMAPKPEERYSSVLELQKALEHFISQPWALPCRSFAAGEMIIREGELGEEAYIILEGRCLVSREGQVLRELHFNEIFGEIGLITARPRSADVQAISPVKLQVITPEFFRSEEFTRWQGPLFLTLAERFRELDSGDS